MKNASSLKSKPETPKTPGGISKSLLTPCRRVGLSRNWRKSVASPFNSPLGNTEAKKDNVETRKRKEHSEETPLKDGNDCDESDNAATPTRKVELPRRKKSKMLLKSITKSTEDDSSQPEETEKKCPDKILPKDIMDNKAFEQSSTPLKSKRVTKEASANKNIDTVSETSTPVRSKSRSKKKPPKSITSKNEPDTSTLTEENKGTDTENENVEGSNKVKNKPIEKSNITENKNCEVIDSENKKIEKKSPNQLTKECIVVIQKKIYKNKQKENELMDKNEKSKFNPVSQALFNDSDSDEIPLNHIKTETKTDIDTITIDDDDDFEISKSKLKKTNSKTSIKRCNSKAKTIPKESTSTTVQVQKPHSQISTDDDDDNFFEKRTILVRKTYDKVVKPSKAKSTGSITDKDIEDLKARIECKKKMLLAKSMTDTKDLRELIKKWQKGCQDALMELMNLMKTKCPDQNMEYPQILQTLKIPASLVGYDSDNDCFVTPDDENIILSHIKE